MWTAPTLRTKKKKKKNSCFLHRNRTVPDPSEQVEGWVERNNHSVTFGTIVHRRCLGTFPTLQGNLRIPKTRVGPTLEFKTMFKGTMLTQFTKIGENTEVKLTNLTFQQVSEDWLISDEGLLTQQVHTNIYSVWRLFRDVDATVERVALE